MDDDKIREIMENLDRMSKELDECKKALMECLDIGDYIGEYGELFIKKDEMKSSVSQVASMMYCLLKFRFFKYVHGNNFRNWFRSIRDARNELIYITCWNFRKDSYDTNIVRYISNEYDEIYDMAIGRCEHVAGRLKKYSVPGLKYLPKECPWEIKDLIKLPYSELLGMIPPYNSDDEKLLHLRIEMINNLDAEYR